MLDSQFSHSSLYLLFPRLDYFKPTFDRIATVNAPSTKFEVKEEKETPSRLVSELRLRLTMNDVTPLGLDGGETYEDEIRGGGGGGGEGAAAAEMASVAGEEVVNMHLVECGNCGRRFNKERLETHKKVCMNLKKERRAFDMKKYRCAGPDLAPYALDEKYQKDQVSSFELCV